MKLRLPNKLQAAIVAALASVSFTTLSTGALAVASGAALLVGQQAAAEVTTGTQTFGTDVALERAQEVFKVDETSLYILKDMTKGTSSGGAMSLDHAVNIWGGNLWAGSYTVSIWVDSASLNSNHLLFAYSGNAPTNSQGANGIYWNAEAKTITIGQGAVANNYGGFTFHSGNTTVSDAITLGDESMVNFTFSVERTNVSSSSGNMVPTVWVNGKEVKTLNGYGGNMNGSQNPITLYVGSGVTYGNVSITNEKLTTADDIYALMGVSTIQPSAGVDYVWTGSENATWDTATANWKTKTDEAPVTFAPGDANTVTFNADGLHNDEVALAAAAEVKDMTVTGAHYALNLGGNALTTATLTIDTDATLTVAGSGSMTLDSLTGAGSLATGEGSIVTIKKAASNYTGAIAVNAGKLVAEVDNALAGSSVSVGAGGTLVLKTYTGVPSVTGTGTVQIDAGNGVSYQYHDKSFLENFEGTVELISGNLQIGNQKNKFVKATNLKLTGGALKGWGANFTHSIELAGGTLADASNNQEYSGAINVTKDSIVDASGNYTVTLSGALTGTGEITKAGTGTLKLSGDNTGYEGGLYADAGTVNITTATTLGSLRVGSGTLNIKADTTVNGTLTIGPASNHYAGTLVVDTDKTLSVASIATPWGFNTMTVNGTLTVRDGGQFSITSNQNNKVVNGTGTINTPKLVVGNATTKGIFAGGLTLNIGNGGITGNDASHIRDVEFRDVTVGVLDGSNGWSAANAVTLAAGEGKATTFNIGDGKKVTLNGAVSGSGSLVKTGSGVLEITSASGYTGTYTVNEGELLFIGNLPNTLTAGGDGVLQLMGGAAEGQDSQSTDLKTVIAPNLHLGRSTAHNSRFVYNGSTNLTEVGHLYFDGAQVWLNGTDMAYEGAVTFNATTYTERGQDILAGAAMRLNNNATFSGAVEVAEDTKLAWAVAGGTSVTFAGKVTGDGDLNLKGWNGGTGTFRVSGDASEYAGVMTTDSVIALAVEESAKLSLAGGSNLQGSVWVDGDLSMDGSSTIGGAVSGSGTLAKTGEGTTQVSGSMASYTGSVDVQQGTLNVQNTASLSVKDITIGTGATMGVYTDTVVAEANEGKVTMAANTTLKAGAGATLNADLEMQSGSTLTVADDDAWRFGGLTMGSSVYLNTGNLLGEGDLTRLGSLGFGDYYYLFSDVENLYINDAQVGKLDFKDWQHYNMDANQVFTNLNPQTYALVYNWDNGSNVGGVALTLLPEPTTGTLSLLALAALAARRRKY